MMPCPAHRPRPAVHVLRFPLPVIAIVLIGCGTHNAAPLCSPGLGSGTLTVTARVSAINTADDGSPDSARYSTSYQVDVLRNGEPVTDADVVFFIDILGQTRLIEGPPGSGRYVTTVTGYPGVSTLTIEAGDDYLNGAFCRGPDIHAIAAPAADSTHAVGTDLGVTWTRDTDAQSVIVSSYRFNSAIDGTPAADTGSYVIPGEYFTLPASSDDISIARGNAVELRDSGSGESSLSVEIVNSVKITLVQ